MKRLLAPWLYAALATGCVREANDRDARNAVTGTAILAVALVLVLSRKTDTPSE